MTHLLKNESENREDEVTYQKVLEMEYVERII